MAERTPYLMEPTLEEYQRGMTLPADVVMFDDNIPRYRDNGQPVPIVRRPGVLPIAATPDGGWTLAAPKALDVIGNIVPGLKGERAVSLASKSARIYNPPAKPLRPFEADYPKGAPADEAGRLTHTIDGDPINPDAIVVGRRVAGGLDEAIPPERAYAIAEAITGNPVARPASREIGGDAGRFKRDYLPDGRPFYAVVVDKALDGTVADRVVQHELGHAIDYFAGNPYIDSTGRPWATIPLKGPAKPVREVYNDLNNTDLATARNYNPNVDPKSRKALRGWTPEMEGYKKDDVPLEYTAELIRAYMADPNYIKSVAPDAAKALRKAANSNPNVNRYIQFNANVPAGAAMADPWAEFRVQPSPTTTPADPWADFRVGPPATQAAPGDNTIVVTRQPPAPPTMGSAQAFGRGAVQGATAGFADEMAAAGAATPIPGNTVQRPTANAIDALAGAARMGLEYLAPETFGNAGGRAYDERLAAERAQNEKAARDAPVAYIGGQVAGGAALPAGAATTAAHGAKTGAIMGALYGAGQGEGLADRAQGAAVGGALGGAAGGLVGGLMPNTATRPANEIAGAAARQGIPIPRAVASDSRAVNELGTRLSNIPFAGQPLQRGAQEAIQAIDDRVGALGGRTAEEAGSTASGAIRDWIGPRSSSLVERAYDAVDGAVNQSVRTPLTATQQAAADILARRQNAAIGDSRAIGLISDAITQPGGLNYQGIKDLRSYIGRLTKQSILPEGLDKAEVGQIYRALSDDLGSAVRNAGGARAEALWQRANGLNRAVAQRREALAKIVGKDGNASPAKVFDSIRAAATNSSRENTALLAQVRRVAGEDWDDIVAGVTNQLGVGRGGEFSPATFVSNWNKMTDAGKAILYSNNSLRQSLDDIATISRRFGQLQKYANPSGSGAQVIFGAGVGGGLWAAPLTTIGTVLGGRALANALATPATASSMAKWARAYQFAVAKPGAGTLSALNIASRNLAGTVSDKLGVALSPQQLLAPVLQKTPADNEVGSGQGEGRREN